MKKNLPRRTFLKHSVMASTGLTLLPSANVLASVGKTTAQTTKHIDLRSNPFGKSLEVFGTLYDAQTHEPLNNATLNVSYKSFGFLGLKRRAQLHTNAEGRYCFLMDHPERLEGAGQKVEFEIRHGLISETTTLYCFNNWSYIDSNHFHKQEALGTCKFPKHQGTSVQFDLSINTNQF